MTENDASAVLVGVFKDAAPAQLFVQRLQEAGVSRAEIGVLTREGNVTAMHAEAGAAAGALTGGAWGVLLGAIVANGILPGVGTVIAGGLLAGVVGGAAVGAAAGGVIGALVGLGVDEDQARHYERAFHAGGILVVVNAGSRLGEARAILAEIQDQPSAADHFDDEEGLAQLDELL